MQKVDTEPYLSTNSLSNQSDALTEIRIKNPKQLIIAHLNINSLRNKFDQLKILVQDKIDILVVTESKLDPQFHIPGYKVPFRKDRNKLGGGIIVFVRDDIPCKKLDVRIPEDIEALFLEINLRHTKWLFCGCYHPPSQNDAYFYQNLSNCLDLFSKKYTNFFLVGDFNSEETETVLSGFLNSHNAKNVVKEKTCFKSMNSLRCVDQLILNKEKCFKSATELLIRGYQIFIKWF